MATLIGCTSETGGKNSTSSTAIGSDTSSCPGSAEDGVTVLQQTVAAVECRGSRFLSGGFYTMDDVTVHRRQNSITRTSETASSTTCPEISYSYTAPLNSPFYHKVVSPACTFLVDNNIVPIWVTPNQLSFSGLVFAVLSVIFARLGLYSLVAPCWILYALFDNVDGGDFVDHAIDSVVASLSALVIVTLLIPTGSKAWVCVLLTISSQLAFFLGSWAHIILGRLLLGTQISGTDIFTVDELNFLGIPCLCLLRIFFPSLIDYPCLHGQKIITLLGSLTSSCSVGLIVVHGFVVGSAICSATVIFRVYQNRMAPLLLPGLIFALVSAILLPPIMLMIPCFSLMSFELITYRLKHKSTGITRIWQPVILFSFISLSCRWFAVDVTWGLSNPLTAIAAISLCSTALALLIHYKDALNSRQDVIS